MPNLFINNKKVAVREGSTVLEAARSVGIHIPTLCYLEGYEHYTSCMICVVYEKKTDSLLPACSVIAEEGMYIVTENEQVLKARKDTLDLLVSEHVGDCQAPCQRACPAHINIPLMIRQIRSNHLDRAIETIKQDIALPAVLGRICPAPCENACARKYYDNPVSICALKRYVADVDLAQPQPYQPKKNNSSNKKVAIIGSGPTGLSAAYYMRQNGYSCFIYDKNTSPGGALRYGVPEEKLPREVLEAEIEQISEFGVTFLMEQTLGKDVTIKKLQYEYDAVVLAVGSIDPEAFESLGLEVTPRGVKVDKNTYQTSMPGVFAGGNAIAEGRIAVRSVAHGKSIADSVNQFLENKSLAGLIRTFNSILGKIRDEEIPEFLKEAQKDGRVEAKGGFAQGYSASEAEKESGRCFHCDCRKVDSCKLREYATLYGADQRHYRLTPRKNYEKILQHSQVIYEPGKCIKCGLCVQITKEAGETLGLCLVNRGFDVRISAPLHESLQTTLMKAARRCVENCPTAALAWRENNKDSQDAA